MSQKGWGGKVEDECPGGKTNVRRPCPTGPVIRPAGYVCVGKPVWAPGVLTPMLAYPLRFAARKRGGPSARHSLVRAEWRPCTPLRRVLKLQVHFKYQYIYHCAICSDSTVVNVLVFKMYR